MSENVEATPKKRGLAAMTKEQRTAALEKARLTREENRKNGIKTTKKMTARRAIKVKCLDCSSGSVAEVRACPVKACSLWMFRCKNPLQIKPTEAEEQGVAQEDPDDDKDEAEE